MDEARTNGDRTTQGRYLYCIVNAGTRASFGPIGINREQVYAVAVREIAAIVHACPAEPYESGDEKTVKQWILAHQHTVDMATERFGTVLPFGFDTIVKGDDGRVEEWLIEHYGELKQDLDRLKDRAEYGVQVFWDRDAAGRRIEENNQEVRKLRNELGSKPKGIAYMMERRVKSMVEELLNREMETLREDLYSRISVHAEEVRVEPPKTRTSEGMEGMEMLLNLSCLVHRDDVESLGDELETINGREEFSVRFTGPWAPFSFAGSSTEA